MFCIMYGGSLKKTLNQPPKVTNRTNVKSRENEIRAEGGIEKWHRILVREAAPGVAADLIKYH